MSQAWLRGLPLPAPPPGAAATPGLGFEAAPVGVSWLCTLCDLLALGQGVFQILCAQNEMGPLFILVPPAPTRVEAILQGHALP